jgi:D-3-phosphoglycerate dehydrogenase
VQPFGKVAEVSEASGTEDQLIEALDGCSALVSQLAPVTKRVIESAPDLRFVGVSRGGPVNVNLEAARERGVVVVNAPGRNAIATAEMTVALMLAVTRGVPSAHATLAARRWQGELYRFDRSGIEIAGTTVGLVGYGAVGKIVARILMAMSADVLVYDPFVAEGELPAGVERLDNVDELFLRSGIISLHARLTPETLGILSAERIALMSPGGFVINAARGPLADYDAIVSALRSNHLAGAAFDVFPDEPVNFGHPLFDLLDSGANIVLTPHIAGASQQVARRAAAIVAGEFARFLSGEPLRHPL